MKATTNVLENQFRFEVAFPYNVWFQF